ncbi:uncharacterized protein LOC134777282 [Penaeus indicus]|uniref:uncharacterized protein LOC134777282 n=1 Tax=Penaeus indicus TaxID=29960 RepID=UPI00300C692D
MNAKVLLVLGVVGCAVADRRPTYSHNEPESRDGDYTQGSYYVQLPDSRLQKVTYYVNGDSGYVAEISYEGEARYDSAESREYGRPVYSPPRPVYSQPSRVYSSPESEESLEIPAYISPRPIYGPPRPTYG